MAICAYYSWRYLGNPDYPAIMGGINLAIHELGHVIFRPFGRFIMSAGGTILQCAAPVAALAVLLRQPDYYGLPVCLVWLGSNFFGVGRYAADARARELPLVTLGGSMDINSHDWYDMLNRIGLLTWDEMIGNWFVALGYIAVFGGLGVSIGIVVTVRRQGQPQSG